MCAASTSTLLADFNSPAQPDTTMVRLKPDTTYRTCRYYRFRRLGIDCSSVIRRVEIVRGAAQPGSLSLETTAENAADRQASSGHVSCPSSFAMPKQPLVPSLAVTILCSTLPATARDLPPAIRMSAACAPIGANVPSRAQSVAG